MLTKEKERLLKVVEQLSDKAQDEVLDFAEFLVSKNTRDSKPGKNTLDSLLETPLNVPGFKPLTREECHAR